MVQLGLLASFMALMEIFLELKYLLRAYDSPSIDVLKSTRKVHPVLILLLEDESWAESWKDAEQRFREVLYFLPMEALNED